VRARGFGSNTPSNGSNSSGRGSKS
jgi:hypothetical protein